MDNKCNAAASLAKVKAACVGKRNCTVLASNAVFGGDPCVNTKKWLAAEISCGAGTPCGTASQEQQRRFSPKGVAFAMHGLLTSACAHVC